MDDFLSSFSQTPVPHSRYLQWWRVFRNASHESDELAKGTSLACEHGIQTSVTSESGWHLWDIGCGDGSIISDVYSRLLKSGKPPKAILLCDKSDQLLNTAAKKLRSLDTKVELANSVPRNPPLPTLATMIHSCYYFTPERLREFRQSANLGLVVALDAPQSVFWSLGREISSPHFQRLHASLAWILENNGKHLFDTIAQLPANAILNSDILSFILMSDARNLTSSNVLALHHRWRSECSQPSSQFIDASTRFFFIPPL